MTTYIVVPARYGSTRFPGKPLIEIGGISMLRRVAQIAQKASQQIPDCDYIVATDDERIQTHCQAYNISSVLTDKTIPTGSDRALRAVKSLKKSVKHVINLQGDAPFTPVSYIVSMADKLMQGHEVVTPYVRLSWDELDDLRRHKTQVPFSGTSVIVDANGQAKWFSKNIIPAIRQEARLRNEISLSPVCRHIGLYGFKLAILEEFVSLSEGEYERLEGLEQLRLLENNIPIQCVEVEASPIAMSGIDTPEDAKLAERLLEAFGDPFQ